MTTEAILKETISGNFPEAGAEYSDFRGDFTVTIDKKFIVPVAKFLKEESTLQFVLLEDMTAVDWATGKNRFSTVYHAYSLYLNFRLRIMCPIDAADCTIDTVSSIWKTADWEEREVYDMFGITFNNHPDLRRMYMPEEFEYHPLRKEFPVMGIPGSRSLPKK